MLDLLEPDNFKRNSLIFIASVLFFLTFSAFYFVSNHGCEEYAENLRSCTPYKCTQRVMGFESSYVGHTANTISREIIGPEADQFIDKRTCKVIEIDNVKENKKTECNYSDKTMDIAASRAIILFGTAAPPPENPEKSLSTMEKAAKRASYATRSPEQMAECVNSQIRPLP